MVDVNVVMAYFTVFLGESHPANLAAIAMLPNTKRSHILIAFVSVDDNLSFLTFIVVATLLRDDERLQVRHVV